MKVPRWWLKETINDEWMILLIAANGEPLIWSESYTRKEDAERALATIRAAARWASFSGTKHGKGPRWPAA